MTLLSSAATAEREANAKIIAAKADVEAAKLMKESSEILNSDAAMQIRHLEVVSKLAHSHNTKIIFMNPNTNKSTATNLILANEV